MPPDNDAPDLAGYQSTEDLVKGYRSSSDEAKRQKNRADEAERRLQLFEQQFQQTAMRSSNGHADPEARLQELGIPIDALEQFVVSRQKRAISEEITPLVQGAQARNTMMASYPDYQKFEADVAKAMEADPDFAQRYQRMFKADPEAALEFAFLKYSETSRKSAAQNGGGNGEVQRARSGAQIPSKRQGDARTISTSQSDEAISRGWEHYQKSGDPRAFAKARLGQVIREEFLNR